MQLRAAAALQLPVIVTEQYPKALGSSVAELQECLPEGSPGARALARAGPLACGTCGEACPRCPPSFIIPTLAHTPPPTLNSPIQIPPTPPAVVAKTKFSMCTEEVDAALGALPGVRSVLIVGLETHVCVLQTSLDLIGVGFGGRGGGGGGAVVVGGVCGGLVGACEGEFASRWGGHCQSGDNTSGCHPRLHPRGCNPLPAHAWLPPSRTAPQLQALHVPHPHVPSPPRHPPLV